MGKEFEMLPGTVATRGCGPFAGYAEVASNAVSGRGNPDITKHRFYSTMQSIRHLQEEVRRVADSAAQSVDL